MSKFEKPPFSLALSLVVHNSIKFYLTLSTHNKEMHTTSDV